MLQSQKRRFLQKEIQHIDIKSFDSVPLVEQFEKMAFQARNLAKAAKIYDKMLSDFSLSLFDDNNMFFLKDDRALAQRR